MSGRALVVLRTDRSYLAEVHVIGEGVHCVDVRRRLWSGEEPIEERMSDRMWSIGEVREVRWLGDRETE